MFCWLTWKITTITFKQNELLYEICKLNLHMHSTTSCGHDAFRKKKKSLVKSFSVYGFFSACKCFKFLLPMPCLYMRSILPKCWAVTSGGYILKWTPITVHISWVSLPFYMGISKVPKSLLYLRVIFLADSLKQGMSWNINSSARFQLCLSHLGLYNSCSLKVRPALKVC